MIFATGRAIYENKVYGMVHKSGAKYRCMA
jgi:hypothetical protein